MITWKQSTGKMFRQFRVGDVDGIGFLTFNDDKTIPPLPQMVVFIFQLHPV
jgi:hypothetical protein